MLLRMELQSRSSSHGKKRRLIRGSLIFFPEIGNLTLPALLQLFQLRPQPEAFLVHSGPVLLQLIPFPEEGFVTLIQLFLLPQILLCFLLLPGNDLPGGPLWFSRISRISSSFFLLSFSSPARLSSSCRFSLSRRSASSLAPRRFSSRNPHFWVTSEQRRRVCSAPVRPGPAPPPGGLPALPLLSPLQPAGSAPCLSTPSVPPGSRCGSAESHRSAPQSHGLSAVSFR